MATPEGAAAGKAMMVKMVEDAWRAAGLEPNQPTRTHHDMMVIVDFFLGAEMKMNGGHWEMDKGYYDTEELGVRVYGANGGNTAYQFLEKMGGFMKYVQPIFDSQIKFDAFVEKTRDLLKAKGPTT